MLLHPILFGGFIVVCICEWMCLCILLLLCVYLCMGWCTCMSKCVYVCVGAKDPHWDLFFRNQPPYLWRPYFLVQSLSLVGCWHILMARLAGHSAPGICMSPPSQLWDKYAHDGWVFAGVLWLEASSLYLCGKQSTNWAVLHPSSEMLIETCLISLTIFCHKT